MATRIVLTDDLDGSEPAHTVVFSLDGIDFEMELSEENIARLWGVFEPYVKVARPARPDHR